MMERDKVFHQEQLLKHCWVCGDCLQKTQAKQKSTTYSCADNSETLKEVFGIDITNDNKSIHPPEYCKACHLALGRTKNAIAKGVPYRNSLQFFNWTGHTDACEVGVHKMSKYVIKKKYRITMFLF